MPKNQKLMVKNFASSSVQKKTFDSLINTFCDFKEIQSAKLDNVIKIFKETEERVFLPGKQLHPLLLDIRAEIFSAYRLDYNYESKITLIPAPEYVNKNDIFKLPPVCENVATRIILLSGTYEIFYFDTFSKLVGGKGILMTPGKTMKVSFLNETFSCDNKGYYDKNFYSGRGIKYPNKRNLIIFDFISNQDIKK